MQWVGREVELRMSEVVEMEMEVEVQRKPKSLWRVGLVILLVVFTPAAVAGLLMVLRP